MSIQPPEGTEVITIRPGDRLIFRTPQPVNAQQAAEMRAVIVERLGDDIPFLIAPANISLTVLRRETEEDPSA